MTFGLPESTFNKIIRTFRSFPEVKRVVIYGSRAKGNFRPGSDIDLTIQESTIDFNLLNRIHQELEALHTPYSFDLSVFEEIKSPELVDHIQRVGKLFYSHEKISS